MIINLIWDSSVTSSAQVVAFEAAVQAAANVITGAFSDNITLNFRVGLGEISNAAGTTSTAVSAGVALGGPSSGNFVSYSTLKADLLANANSADDNIAYNSLTGTQDPNANGSIAVWRSQEKALGITAGGTVSANDSGIDGEIGIGTGWSAASWTRVALHEITHAMGRTSGYASYGILDMFRYTAAGTHVYDGSTGVTKLQYFSTDGGVTDLANYATSSDYGDWNGDALTSTDANDAFYSAGPNALSTVDLTQLDVIGFKRTNAVQTLTVAQAIAAYNANNAIAAMSVLDTAANVAGSLDTLQSITAHGNISSIALTGSTKLTVLAAHVTADAGALAKITGGYSLAVADSSSNVAANLDSLQANLATIASITLQGTTTLGLSASQVSSDAGALAKMTGTYSIAVTDTAAHVSAYLDALQVHIGTIGSITLSDVATGTIILSAAQLTSDSLALSKILGTYALSVNDTTSLTYTLGANVNKLTLTGSGSATITANAIGSTIIGNAGTDSLIGGAGNDRLVGGTGNDTFIGGAGNDTIIGGSAANTAVYSGTASQYSIVRNADGSFTITDQRAGSPDGTDTLTGIQVVQFADGTRSLTGLRTPNDFNADGTSDVLLQNGGTVVDWLMGGGFYKTGNVLTTGATGFTVVGKGDVNGDGTADVVLQNGNTVVDWIMKNGAYQSGNVVATNAGGYTVVGVGDLNGDGTADLVLQNGATVIDWVMQNGVFQSSNVLTTAAAGWTVVGTGDFNRDGTADVLLQNGGTVVNWIMQNGSYQSGNILTIGAAGWTVVGTGDFNGDGTSDVLLQNGGTVVDWIMQNGVYQFGNIITTAAAGFTVVGTGDYNGDGTSDVLLQNGGTVVDWIMKDGLYQSGNVITTGANGFTVR